MIRTEFDKYLKINNITVIGRDDTSVSFTVEGLNLITLYDDNDPYYFRLMLPNMLEVNDSNSFAVLKVLNALNLKYKSAKAMILHENVWAAVEMFVYSPIGINGVFDKSINVLKGVYTEFKKEKDKL